MNYLSFALEYHAAGLQVIPFSKTGNKINFPSWHKYREGQTETEIRNLFSGDADGIAMLTGNGIEAIDIDVKHDPRKTIDRAFFDHVKQYAAGEDALQKSVIQKTKSGGWHIIYKTESKDGNQKIAHLQGCKEAVIETRGVGGLLFVHPTPGYEVKRGEFKDMKNIGEGRDCFMRCARELSERSENLLSVESAAKPMQAQTMKPDGTSPGDDFNAQHDVQDIAEKYGWRVVSRHGGTVRLTRPGSSSGDVHASIITTRSGEKRFYPFTTSTAYDAEKCYSPFTMYAVEEFNGNLSEAAKELYKQGFGSRIEKGPPPAATTMIAPKDVSDLVKRAAASTFDFHAPLPNEEAILNLNVYGKNRKVGGFGQIGVFVGHEKSGKSFVLSCVVASAYGQNILGFDLNMKGKKIAKFDTEQPHFFYALNERRMHIMAGLNDNAPNYQAQNLRPFSADERIEIVEEYLKSNKNLGVLILDGIVQFLKDYNNLQESQAMMARLMRWSEEYNILILVVIHLNKGDGKIRGHIGSELKNQCDFLISVTKTGERDYEVSNPASRYGEFPMFQFQRDDEGYPIWEGQVSNSFPVKQKMTVSRQEVEEPKMQDVFNAETPPF